MRSNIHAILAAAMLAALMLLAGCSAMGTGPQSRPDADGGGPSMTSAKRLAMADALAREGEFTKAHPLYKAEAEADPGNGRALLGAADCLAGMGKEEEALARYMDVLALDPDSARANLGAGRMAFKAGFLAKAETYLARASALDPNLWRAENSLGLIAGRLGRPDQAVEHFAKALSSAASKAEVYNNLGVALMLKGDHGPAVDAFTQAVKHGGDKRAYNNLGLALAALEKYEAALSAFRYASGEAQACNNLGYALLMRGRYGEAIPWFEKALDNAPSYYVVAGENLKRARMAVAVGEATRSSEPLMRMEPARVPDRTVENAAPVIVKASHAVEAAVSGPDVPVRPVSFHAPVERPAAELPAAPAWGVLASSWKSRDKAVQVAEDLSRKGLDARVDVVDLESGRWHRVLVGAYGELDKARARREEIRRALGLEQALIYRYRHPLKERPAAGAVL